MSTALATKESNSKIEAVERALIQGDLSGLSEVERLSYYTQVCESVGLNPLTKPFEYLKLNGKLTLYALKACTDQLRKVNNISIGKPEIQFEEGLVIVSITARDRIGREDSDVGAVAIGNLQGEARANAIMKAITKSKRRVTLSICGLGMLDETEVETIPNAQFGDAALRQSRPSPQLGGLQTVEYAPAKSINKFWATARGSGYSDNAVKLLLADYGCFNADGQASSKAIPMAKFSEVLRAADSPEQATHYNAKAQPMDEADAIDVAVEPAAVNF